MTKIEYNDENMSRLAEEVIMSWPLFSVIQFAIGQKVRSYHENPDFFEEDCEEFKEIFDE